MRLAFAFAVATATLTAQDFTVSVPNSVLNSIGDVLPESSNAGAAYASDSFAANIDITQDCNLDVVFLWEGAGYQNTMGYFTYQDNPDGSVTILSSDLLIPNASFGTISTGHGYRLKDASDNARVFTAGEKVGFFLIADGNRRASSLVNNWTFSESGVPSNDGETNRQVGRGLYTTINEINPEFALGHQSLSRHMALIWMPAVSGFLDGEKYLLCGFEDLPRQCCSDEDFNDLVFVVRANPIEAIEDTEAFEYDPNDSDGDGVSGINDHFPEDAERATLTRTPSSGYTMLAFEDLYPDVGDADYNDAVFAYYFEVVSDADGDVKDIQATFALIARGAAYEAALGIHIPGLPAGATGTYQIERFLSTEPVTNEVTTAASIATLIASGNRRVENIFPSLIGALPPPSGQTFTNTLFAPEDANGASARIKFTFETAVSASLLGDAPYDLFIALDRGFGNGIWDIHKPGFDSFSDRSTHLPTESGSTAFLDSNGYPWALEVPLNWRYPMENVNISTAYPLFDGWRTSGGSSNANWYGSPSSADGEVGPEMAGLVPSRTWTVDIPR